MKPPPGVRATLPRYSIALLTSGLAGVLTAWVGPLVGSPHALEFFYIAVVVSAVHGGIGPGLVATTISVLAMHLLVVPAPSALGLPANPWSPWKTPLFASVAVLASVLIGRLKDAQRRLAGAHDDLETRLRHRTDELSRANERLNGEVTRRLEAERATVEAIAREQHRLGQDLHDGLCQTIAGARLLVEGLRQKTGDGSRELQTIETQLTEALGQADSIARGLDPVELETNGLVAALEALAAKVSTVHPVECRFRCPRPVAVPDHATALHLYRIAQEAVANGIKGGKASRVHLRLLDRGPRTVLTIADNGTGLGNGPARQGMGLQIMAQRARMIDAELTFRSRRTGGTLVTCAVPAGDRPDGGNDGR
jgi:signal transduction histidine kinase